MRREIIRDQFIKGLQEAKRFRKKTVIGSQTDWGKWDAEVLSKPLPYFLGHIIGDILLDLDPKQRTGSGYIEITVDESGKPIPSKEYFILNII